MSEKYFPVFLNIEGYKILMVGAGTIATRRVKGLLSFGACVTVVAPEISEDMQQLAKEYQRLELQQRSFVPGEIDGYQVVLTATDAPEVEHQVYEECKGKGIPVSVASDRSKCDFYFPALIETDDVVVGVSGTGKDHKKVRSISAKIRELLN